MKLRIISAYILTLFAVTALNGEALIIGHLVKPDLQVQQDVKKQLDKKLGAQVVGNYVAQTAPHKLAVNMVKGQVNQMDTLTLGGFPFLYQGYIDYSDQGGLFQMPLRHNSPYVQVIITTHINLDTIKGNTISHTELNGTEPSVSPGPSSAGDDLIKNGQASLDASAPVKIYLIEKKTYESKPGSNEQPYSYFKVSETQPPADKKIPPTALVILTNPANIYIPQGNFYTTTAPQMVLPKMYVVGSQGRVESEMFASDISRFFEQVNATTNRFSDTKNQRHTTNN